MNEEKIVKAIIEKQESQTQNFYKKKVLTALVKESQGHPVNLNFIIFLPEREVVSKVEL